MLFKDDESYCSMMLHDLFCHIHTPLKMDTVILYLSSLLMTNITASKKDPDKFSLFQLLYSFILLLIYCMTHKMLVSFLMQLPQLLEKYFLPISLLLKEIYVDLMSLLFNSNLFFYCLF